MLLTLGYVYTAKYLAIEGDITRNVYTLVFLQDKKMINLAKDEEELAKEQKEKDEFD